MSDADTRRDATITRVHEFLAHGDNFADTSPMWIMGGTTVTWGDLRVLAEYQRTEPEDRG